MAINITRTAAVTTEQVITNKRGKLIAVLPELAATTGTLALRNEKAAVTVGIPGTITATKGAGGALSDDEWFITVVSVDANGDISAEGTEDSDTTETTNNTINVTWVAPATLETPSGYRVYIGTSTGSYDGYYEVAAGVLSLAITADAGYDVAGDGPGAVPTTGNTNLKHLAAIGLLAAGKDFQGALFPTGITIQQSVTTDRCAVLWEALTG